MLYSGRSSGPEHPTIKRTSYFCSSQRARTVHMIEEKILRARRKSDKSQMFEHGTTIYYSTFWYISLHFTTLHNIILHDTPLYCIVLHYTTSTLYCIVLHYTTSTSSSATVPCPESLALVMSRRFLHRITCIQQRTRFNMH